jgi:hypothetical protein
MTNAELAKQLRAESKQLHAKAAKLKPGSSDRLLMIGVAMAKDDAALRILAAGRK